VNYLPQAWETLIEQSLRLLQQNEKERKELYLLSDLTMPTWQETLDGSLIEQLRSAPDISLQVIDVGVEQPHNDALVDLQLSGQLLANGSPLEIRARVARSGPAGAGTVRVCVEPQDPSGPILVDGRLDLPPAAVRGEQPVEWDRDGSANVSFNLASLELGTHHGYVESLATMACRWTIAAISRSTCVRPGRCWSPLRQVPSRVSHGTPGSVRIPPDGASAV